MINEESVAMDNEAMTRQHVRLAVAEATLYAAELSYEMTAAALDRASQAVVAARSTLTDEQKALASQRARAQLALDELTRKATELMDTEGGKQ